MFGLFIREPPSYRYKKAAQSNSPYYLLRLGREKYAEFPWMLRPLNFYCNVPKKTTKLNKKTVHIDYSKLASEE